jgi:peroxiredoxin
MSRRASPRRRLVFGLMILVIACCIDEVRAQASPAPDFVLRSLERGNQRLSEYRGDVVVLSFWASWCGDCRRSLPQLNDLYARHRDAGLMMLGINLDQDPQRARQFVRVLELNFPVLMDADGVVSRLYAVEHVPRIVVIDREGVMRHVYDGADAAVPNLLAEKIVALLGS